MHGFTFKLNAALHPRRTINRKITFINLQRIHQQPAGLVVVRCLATLLFVCKPRPSRDDYSSPYMFNGLLLIAPLLVTADCKKIVVHTRWCGGAGVEARDLATVVQQPMNLRAFCNATTETSNSGNSTPVAPPYAER